MKSENVRITTAFLSGCFLVSLLFFCLGQTPHELSVKVQLFIEKKKSELGNISMAHSSVAQEPLHRPPQDPALNLPLNRNKKFIILLTSFRSGSTFLGSLFDSNPTMQYLFEPFHNAQIRTLRKQSALFGARADHTESDLRMLYLQQMLHNCTMHVSLIYSGPYTWCGTQEERIGDTVL